MTLAQVKAAFPDQGVEEQMAAASARIAEAPSSKTPISA
jgi:hypothetical protein